MIELAIATLGLAMIGDEHEPDLLDLLGERCYPEGEDVFMGSREEVRAQIQADYEHCLGKPARVKYLEGQPLDQDYEPQWLTFDEGIEVIILPTSDSDLHPSPRSRAPRGTAWVETEWAVELTPESLAAYPHLKGWTKFLIFPKKYGFPG